MTTFHSIPIHIDDRPEEQRVPVEVQSRAPVATAASQPSAKRSRFSYLMHMDVRGVLLVMAFAVSFLAVGVSYMNKKIVQELQEKDMQVNSLIDELGELHAHNELLNQQMLNRDATLTLIQESVIALEERVAGVDASGGVFGLQAKLDEANAKVEAQNAALETLMTAGLTLARDPIVPEDATMDFLILGTNGRLTDTIMVASVNEEKDTVSLFSIPRDLAVDGRRINEYYYKYGIDPLRDKIEVITGLYPEQYVVFDLASFETVIDLLGGVDVTVEKDIYDTMYPGPNYTYTTFSLPAGEHHLDGKTALMFARSRKSTTDFDRAARQQQIIEAVRTKFSDLSLLANADELVEIYNTVSAAVDTDVDLLSLVSYATQYEDYTIERGNVLSTTNYLYPVTGTDGAYLVIPRDGTYEEIRQYIADVVQE